MDLTKATDGMSSLTKDDMRSFEKLRKCNVYDDCRRKLLHDWQAGRIDGLLAGVRLDIYLIKKLCPTCTYRDKPK